MIDYKQIVSDLKKYSEDKKTLDIPLDDSDNPANTIQKNVDQRSKPVQNILLQDNDNPVKPADTSSAVADAARSIWQSRPSGGGGSSESKPNRLSELASGDKKAPSSYTGTTGNSYTGANSYYTKNPEVFQMQIAIKRLADTVVSKTFDKDADKSRNHFNDFIIEMAGKSEIHGEEWTDDSSAIERDKKLPSNMIDFQNVINQFNRIGPSKNELGKDGIWDFRTDNAVKNTYAFAKALTKVVSEFGKNKEAFRYSDFTTIDLADFSKAILTVNPDGDKTSNESDNEYLKLVKRSTFTTQSRIITKIIVKLTKFYQAYFEFIASHPQYRGYIQNKPTHPMFKVKEKTKQPELKKSPVKPPQFIDKTTYEGKNLYIDGSYLNKDKFKYIPVEALKNKESFKQWMINTGAFNAELRDTAILDATIRDILTKISNHVKDSLDKHTKQLEDQQNQFKRENLTNQQKKLNALE